MTTQSDRSLAAAAVAAEVPATGRGPMRGDTSVPPRARARARVATTEGDGKSPGLVGQVAADVRGWWGWTAEPMSRAEVVAARIPSPDAVPDGSGWLRGGWAVWMHLVAIPATWLLLPPAGLRLVTVRQLLRGVVWVAQHPGRFVLAAPVVVALILIWFVS